MNRSLVLIVGVLVAGVIIYILQGNFSNPALKPNLNQVTTPITTPSPNPLAITQMRARSYPGSEMKIERVIAQKPTYIQYYASYLSDGLKIYGLLTVPKAAKPTGGFPVIIFNHGYIAPEVYRTTERYVAYQDTFARNGYVTFKSDYRGHDQSEGIPTGGHFSPDYTVDVLNGMASVEQLKDPINNTDQLVANPQKIGMWGHSMGGSITQRAMVVSKDIKAGVIWGGVVGSYEVQYIDWYSKRTFSASPREQNSSRVSIQDEINKMGLPDDNNPAWQQISPVNYLNDISGPIQLHHGLADEDVPPTLSEDLKNRLQKLGKTVELYEYPGADHNISSPNFEVAIQRSLEFFDKYVKGG